MTAPPDRDPYKALIEEVADSLHRMWAESDMAVARAILALIAERTKVATKEMREAWEGSLVDFETESQAAVDWSAMHAASPLWPKEEGK